MLIRPSNPNAQRLTRPALAAPPSGRPSFKETAIKTTIVAASLGTVAGEFAGGLGIVAGGGYLGYRAGQSFFGDIGGAVGAVVGAGATLLLEDRVPIGRTLGSVGGFLTGGLVGGVTGIALGGVQAIAHANFFEKG